MSDTLTRRFLLAATALASLPLHAQTTVFSKETALNAMREVAKTAFAPPSSARVLANITPELYANVKYKQPLFITPLHQGGFFQTPTRIHVIENGVSREIAYDATHFDGLPSQEPTATFSGFSYKQDDEEILRFQAGTTFRVKALTQTFGTLARALVLNVAEPTGEEFPGFRQFWIQKPVSELEPLVIYGLFASESVTGLALFSIKTGIVTAIEVEISLIPRVDLTHVGFAPLNAMYLFGLNDKSTSDDVRGSVHDVTGLTMITGANEAIYRPIQNPETLQISSFTDTHPKGFGLTQRERRFDLFQDLDGQFERRPTLFVEPIGEWGEGHVQLVEIPSESQSNKNILCYWRPKKILPARIEMNFAYRLTVSWGEATAPAFITSVRMGKGALKRRRFVVDFSGVNVDQESKLANITPILSNRGGKLHAISMRFNAENAGARVTFELDSEGLTSSELRLVLESDKKPLSETMLYRWTP